MIGKRRRATLHFRKPFNESLLRARNVTTGERKRKRKRARNTGDKLLRRDIRRLFVATSPSDVSSCAILDHRRAD